MATMNCTHGPKGACLYCVDTPAARQARRDVRAMQRDPNWTSIPGKLKASADTLTRRRLQAINKSLSNIQQRGYATPHDLNAMAQVERMKSDTLAVPPAQMLLDQSDAMDGMTPEQRMVVKHKAGALDLEDMLRDHGMDKSTCLTPVERLLKRRGVKAGRDGKYAMDDVDDALKEEYGQDTETRMMMKTMLDELGMMRTDDEQDRYLDAMPDDNMDEDTAMLRRCLKSVKGEDRREMVKYMARMERRGY